THVVSMAAIAAAADPDMDPELGEPWEVQKVYYNQDLSVRKYSVIHERMVADGLDSPFEEMIEHFAKRGWLRDTWLSTRIECSEFFGVRDRALLSHATQIDPHGSFFSEARKQAQTYWGTEEFELAIDNTGRTPLPKNDEFLEDDLFASVTRDD